MYANTGTTNGYGGAPVTTSVSLVQNPLAPNRDLSENQQIFDFLNGDSSAPPATSSFPQQSQPLAANDTKISVDRVFLEDLITENARLAKEVEDIKSALQVSLCTDQLCKRYIMTWCVLLFIDWLFSE